MARYLVSVCAVLMFATSLATAAPVVVFNSFGPGDMYDGPAGITVGCGALCWHDEGHTSAWSFVPAQTVRLSLVETAAWQFASTPSTLLLAITADNFGLPGATLESFSSPVGPPALLGVTSTAHTVLQAGQRYWFTAGTQDLLNQGANIGISPVVVASGTSAYHIGDGPWIGPFPSGIPPSGYSVFRVTGEAVPEPDAAFAVGLGMCLFVWLRRRRLS